MYYEKTLQASASSTKRTSRWGVEKPLNLDAQGKISPAQAARLNLTSCGIDDESIERTALSILAGGDPNIGKLARKIRTAGKSRQEALDAAHDFKNDLATLPAAHLQYAYVLPPLAYVGPLSSAGYATRLLSRSMDDVILSVLERELRVSPECHGDELCKLRSDAPKIYNLLIRGYLSPALLSGGKTVAVTRSIIAEHAMHLAVATAHLRIRELKSAAQNPLAGGWAGNGEWPTMRMVALEALVQPADVLHQLLSLPVSGSMTDEQALEVARNHGLIGDDSSSTWLISIGNQAQSRMPDHNLARSQVEHSKRAMLKLTEPLKSLEIKDLNEAGWARRSFAEERFGVRASEGAVIVAMNLAVFRERVEECIDAVLERRALPAFNADPTSVSLSNNSLARLTEALRIEGTSDKSAPEKPGDMENHNGKQLVMKTRRQIDMGTVDKALARLRIDPAVYFSRRIEPASIG